MVQALSNRQHAGAVLALGLPLVGSHLAQFAIHMTDTLMLGWHSVEELAAIVLAGSYWFTLFIFGSGFGIAVMPIVASAVSQGDLGFAKTDGERSLSRIASFMDGHKLEAVLFIEPSAMSVVVDEWKDLLGESHLDQLAGVVEKSRLVEDFVGSGWGSHPNDVRIEESGQGIIVHTHCHQKSLWGSGTTMGVFEKVCPGRAELIDAGCCGMAGAFGFLESKFELSNRIGEQRLMPAVRGRGEGEWVVAGGTSCRHQILDATGIRALHPIEAVDRLMD